MLYIVHLVAIVTVIRLDLNNDIIDTFFYFEHQTLAHMF